MKLYKTLCCKLGDLAQLKASIEAKLPLIYLPQPNENGIIPQFDGYFDLKEIDLRKYKESPIVGLIYQDYNSDMLNDYKVAKQADVVELLYQQEDLFPADIKEKNYYYYEERTLHDSSLSKAIHSVLACDLGPARRLLSDVPGRAGDRPRPEDDLLRRRYPCSQHGRHLAGRCHGLWRRASVPRLPADCPPSAGQLEANCVTPSTGREAVWP